MATALTHLCPSCGTDLTGLHPRREPHYGLRLVRCPSCRLDIVRRALWRESEGRTVLRIGSALVAMAAQLFAASVFVVTTIALVVALGDFFHERGWPLEDVDLPLCILVVVMLIGLGAWLTAGLAHWGWRARWGALALLCAVMLTLDTVVAPTCDVILMKLEPERDHWESNGFQWSLLAVRWLILAVLLMVAALGIPPGRVALRVSAIFRRLRWRWRGRPTTAEENSLIMTTTNPPHDENRVSQIAADRYCTKCGYNLIGQSVLREGHYDLLIVRCPECGTVAGVQEYPSLGRWGGFARVFVAVLWLLLLISMIPGTSGMMVGLAIETGDSSSRRYANHLNALHDAAVEQAIDAQIAARAAESGRVDTGEVPEAADPTAPTRSGVPSRVRQLLAPPTNKAATPIDDFSTWWETQDAAAVYADAGGWRGVLSYEAFIMLIPITFSCFLAGVLWSVFMLTYRRRGLLVWALVITLLAALFAVIPIIDWRTSGRWYWNVARAEVAPITMTIAIAYGAVLLGIGMVCGRSVARGLVRAFLPRRLRRSLAPLWKADGLSPP